MLKSVISGICVIRLLNYWKVTIKPFLSVVLRTSILFSYIIHACCCHHAFCMLLQFFKTVFIIHYITLQSITCCIVYIIRITEISIKAFELRQMELILPAICFICVSMCLKGVLLKCHVSLAVS